MNNLKTSPFVLILLLWAINALSAENNTENIKQDEMIKEQFYINVVDSYIRNLNEKDLGGILELFAENGTVEDPVGSEVVKGKAALRKFYSGAVSIDLSLTRTGPVRIAGNEVAFPFQLRMNVEGEAMITDIIDIFRFDQDGKIVSMRVFWGESNRRKAKE